MFGLNVSAKITMIKVKTKRVSQCSIPSLALLGLATTYPTSGVDPTSSGALSFVDLASNSSFLFICNWWSFLVVSLLLCFSFFLVQCFSWSFNVFLWPVAFLVTFLCCQSLKLQIWTKKFEPLNPYEITCYFRPSFHNHGPCGLLKPNPLLTCG